MKRQTIAYILLVLVCTLTIHVVDGLDIAVQNQGADFSCTVLDGVPPFIYVWHSSIDGDFGYVANFTYDKLSAGSHVITVKVADSRTDTQIPAFNTTNNSIQSIISNISVDMYDPTNCLLPRVKQSNIYGYGPPYRCGNTANTCFYRLFDKNTTWVKIFTVTPMLEDKKDKSGDMEDGWYWNWSRTSAPDDEVNITIYVGGGCQRTSAFFFNYTNSITSFYVEPIHDWLNVTIFDGMNNKTEYLPFSWYNVSVGVNCSNWCESKGYKAGCLPCPSDPLNTSSIYCSGGLPAACFSTSNSGCDSPPSPSPDTCDPLYTTQRCACVNPALMGKNQLPFPPADSIEDENGTIIHFHPYEGIRYSYFAINHAVPENASYLDIRVSYTCETELWRNSTCFGNGTPLDEIKDTSTVYDNFTIEFLEHQNTKDNCRWTNMLEWSNVLGVWDRTWDATLQKYVLHLNTSVNPNRRMVSVENVSDNKTIEVLFKGNATGGEIADATIGFYSDKNANSYWFVNLHEDTSGGMLAIGYSIGGVSVIKNSTATPFTDNQWYWISVFITDGNISAKIWPYGTIEPLGWNISYSIPGVAPEVIFDYYMVIGTESGADTEEFWFDPDPRCGINITGYYDPQFLAPFGYSIVTGGFIKIEAVPDILSGFKLSVNEIPRSMHMVRAHPAKHILYRKEKAAPSPPYPDMFYFDYGDRYGYESQSFGFDEICKFPPCPSNCRCNPIDRLAPICTDYSAESPTTYYPIDCICPPNDCYKDPCTSYRNYHEFEGIYYDFIDFYNTLPYESGSNFSSVELGVNYSSLISIDNVSAELNLDRVNSHQGIYEFHFSCININKTNFDDNATITIYTNFRNLTYKLKDVLRVRSGATIFHTVNPAPEDIDSGDLVTISLTLFCGVFPIPNERVEITSANYQNELLGVSKVGDKAYVTTDAVGNANFNLTMRQDLAQITLYYAGGDACGETEDNFIVGSTETRSIITSVEFILLIIIFIIAILSYRFFKRGRLDFHEMWQELMGEKD